MYLINRLFKQKWFPFVFQLITLVSFILLIIIGLSANTNDLAFAKVLRNTNLANLIVWSYWWPLIIVGAVLLGRIWCTICPVELVTSLSARAGFKRKVPRLFKSGWVITLFYIGILNIGVHTLSIHRIPLRMAIYLMALFGVAVIIGFLFEKNAFCAYICPVGYLLGLYARLSPFGWGVKNKGICQNCKDKSCVSRKNLYKFQGRSCGVNLAPQYLEDNTDCLLCGQCLKACDSNNPGIKERPNPGWSKKPWAKDLLDTKPLSMAKTVFILIVSGFVIYEIAVEDSVTKKILLYIPDQIIEFFRGDEVWAKGIIESLTIYFLLPVIIWLIPYFLTRIAGGTISIPDYMKKLSIAFIPIMAAAHIIKSIAKSTSRIPYWKYSLSDPIGIKSARAIQNKAIQLTELPDWSALVITVFVVILMILAILLSLIIIKKNTQKYFSQVKGVLFIYLIPLIYGGLFIAMIMVWRF